MKQNIATAKPATMKMFALVRDANGIPKFDDPENVPAGIYEMLTTDEKEALNNGDYSRNSNP